MGFWPKLEIDRTKCKTPMECCECLRVCPTVALMCRPSKNTKFRECTPEEYVIKWENPLACIGCMDCVRACPEQALKIIYEEVIPKPRQGQEVATK